MIYASQIRASRGLLQISQVELANVTGLSISTIKRLEGSEEEIKKASLENLEKIKKSFEEKNIKFTSLKKEGRLEIGVKLIKNVEV